MSYFLFMSISFKIYTLGCKVNQYDSSHLARKLIASSFELVEKDANLAIVNTCAVTQKAIRKGREIIKKAKRENPKAKIVLMGCFPKAYKEEAEKLGVDLLWEVGELDGLISKIVTVIARRERSGRRGNPVFVALNKGLPHSPNRRTRNNNVRAKYFLKIQDGCEQFCSYCIIPYTRGKLKSRSEKEVIKEFGEVVQAGYKEIVLCGIHLGLFGQGVESRKLKVKSNLVSLLKKLVQIEGLGRIRLSSIEVNEVSDDLIKITAKEKKLCKHLHIPLQAGSDNILKLMNRPYNKKIFKEKIRKIRKFIPDVAITTDVIVGFPGEMEKDFKETCDFVKEVGFSQLHVFPFSAHEKTPAYKMKNQVSREVATKRAEKLRKIGEKLEKDFRKKFIGKEVEVLVEYIYKNGLCRGKSDEYLEVEFENEDYEVGEIVEVGL